MPTIGFPNYVKARDYALSVFAENRLVEPPVIAADLAKKYGLTIIVAEFEGGDAESVSGFLVAQKKKIVVNHADNARQQNFTIAHELGHYLLGHHRVKNYDAMYSVLLRDTRSMEQTWLEREANCFADNLLVPEELLREYIRKSPTLTNPQLAYIFGVPENVIAGRRMRN